MALSSSSHTWKYRVFVSFHGPDIRKTLLSHVRKQFGYNGISMFDDQGIERGQIIAPALTQAIRESRISIVVLSKRYASSTWCLDELVDILKCKEDIGQIVMTIFYGVDPSDVRKQTGDFGKLFNETCGRKSEEDRQRWSQALNDVGNIAGEHFLNWDNESKMIEKIARDVSNKLNPTISKDFEDMVCIEAHLRKLQSLLHLDDKGGTRIVGICGPAGIGKTTIARALHSRLSCSFQLTCFMENIRGSSNSGLDDYGWKLYLQEQLLSKILNLSGININHLGVIPERLCDQKVLIILDDVDDLQKLEALANETNWFGPGNRIIVTTEDQEILEQHDISDTYHVDFPTNEDAYKIFCRYAFRRSLAPYGFKKLVERVTKLCSNLPLGLRVMGSSLRGKKIDDWECILHRLENSLDRKIERVLGVGYDHLHKNDQLLFLLIAFFFNHQGDRHVKAMLGDNNLDVRLGLKTLAYKYVIQVSAEGKIVMHKLLQLVGREAVQRQDPEKRQILIDTDEICDVFEKDYGSRSVMGISFDISTLTNDVYINAGAFKRLCSLLFLSVTYKKKKYDANDRVHVPEDMDVPPQLRLLEWDLYPGKCLPRTFRPEYIVELNLRGSKLEKLWEGIQVAPYKSKKMDLQSSFYLKELPDLSKATNLEEINLNGCVNLIEIPFSIGNLHKLELLQMNHCIQLQVVPTRFNLATLKRVWMIACWELKKFPFISTNITNVKIPDTMLEALLVPIRLWPRLQSIAIYGSVKVSPDPNSVEVYRRRRGADIEKIPYCMKDLIGLKELYIYGCPKLASLPELPWTLTRLTVETCESLETISLPFLVEDISFYDCFKLGQEARRVIIRKSWKACLPGRNILPEFHHRAIGNSLTIPSESEVFRICVVISPKLQTIESAHLLIRDYIDGILIREKFFYYVCKFRTEHLFICNRKILGKPDGELLMVFSTTSQDIVIIECGIQILTYHNDGSTSSQGSYASRTKHMSGDDDYDDDFSDESYEPKSEQISDDDDDDLSDGSYGKSERVCARRNEFEELRSKQVSDSKVSKDLTWYSRTKKFFCV